jgi:dTDP-4-dehydrorhamnose reductase
LHSANRARAIGARRMRLAPAANFPKERSMRVLVSGASGQLAQALVWEFRSAGHEVCALSRAALDVTRYEDVMAAVRVCRPGAILNCSAYNAVDAAEQEEDAAFDVNANGPAYLAAAAEACGAIFVHYSSDFVFDGEAGVPYTEDDVPAPVNAYGRSKLAGERAAARAARHYILRLESVFGGTAPRPSTIDWLADAIVRHGAVAAFVDRTVTPSYTFDVAAATRHLIEACVDPGIYHCVNSGVATWFQLAQELARQLGVRAAVREAESVDRPGKARRPRLCALSNGRLTAAGVSMPHWTDALARHVRRTLTSLDERTAAGAYAPGRSAASASL